MNVEEFLRQLNTSPMFRTYRAENGDFSTETLKIFGLIKESYFIPGDFYSVNNKLTTNVAPTTQQGRKTYPYDSRDKDLAHTKFARIDSETITKARELLQIPNKQSGFSKFLDIIPNSYAYSIDYLQENRLGKQKEFKEFYDWWEKDDGTTRISELNKLAYSVAGKWNLPNRYKEAIIELIVFNSIVPANDSAYFRLNWIEKKSSWEASLVFDKDTTRKELLRLIDSDLKKFQTILAGKAQKSSTKPSLIDATLKRFNDLKKSSSGSGQLRSKDEIYQIIAREQGVSKSTVRKRLEIKGK